MTIASGEIPRKGPMPLAETLLQEFDQEMKGTRKVLERLPEDRLGWRPHEKSWTVAELATHLLSIPHWGTITLETDSFDIAPEGGPPPSPKTFTTVAEALERFDGHATKARAGLAACADDQLAADWALLMKGELRFKLPRAAVWRGMVMNHLIHHRAELCVYLRLLDLPLPALYGPSADERS
jgi:uncharacterized damage-inducible protein DinB